MAGRGEMRMDGRGEMKMSGGVSRPMIRPRNWLHRRVQALPYREVPPITGFPPVNLHASFNLGKCYTALLRGGSGVIRQPRAAVGIYSTNAGVERTFIEFKLCGFDVEDISVVLSSAAHLTTAVPGGANGLTSAATARGTLHWLIGLGAAALQTPDSIIAAGPIAAVMEHTGADGRAGELSSALVNFGIGEREASYCERRVRNGGSLVSVRPSSV